MISAATSGATKAYTFSAFHVLVSSSIKQCTVAETGKRQVQEFPAESVGSNHLSIFSPNVHLQFPNESPETTTLGHAKCSAKYMKKILV
jgi:hypothetical protein